MRLDHLLSKEQHVHPAGIPGVAGWGGHHREADCVSVMVAQGIVELLGICWFVSLLRRASTGLGVSLGRGTCDLGVVGS